jgi:peptidoglycan hydrolase-like protein with peptidoglycan-binding domain
MQIRARTPLALLIAVLAVTLSAPAGASAARYGSRALAPGSHGSDVKQLQRYLSRAGHRTRADGEFGLLTARALRATEAELELRADDVATRREQRLIRSAVAGSGGASYVAPPDPEEAVHGEAGTLTEAGFAVPPASAPQAVKDVIAAGNLIALLPYKWGGGHQRWQDSGYDCSGSVSFALHAAGLLDSPLVSGDFPGWGEPGPGEWITIYGNAGHVYMVVAGMRFDTSARSRTGSRWTLEQRSPRGFGVSHPPGL